MTMPEMFDHFFKDARTYVGGVFGAILAVMILSFMIAPITESKSRHLFRPADRVVRVLRGGGKIFPAHNRVWFVRQVLGEHKNLLEIQEVQTEAEFARQRMPAVEIVTTDEVELAGNDENPIPSVE